MNKQQIYDYLNREKLWHEITEHEAVYNMAELTHVAMPYPACDAKNLFVRDEKKRNYYLITVKGDKRVDLKEFRKNNNTAKLSFASAEDLLAYLGLTPGSVTPFGLLNDTACKVTFYLDEDFLRDPAILGIHPNENTATVWMKAADLIALLRQGGHTVQVVPL